MNKVIIPVLCWGDNISWGDLSSNPSIFCCDYAYYKKRMDVHRVELMKKVHQDTEIIYTKSSCFHK